MRIDAAFPSDYLKAADLEGNQVTYTISSVKIEAVGQQKEERPVLCFDDCEKGLILNKTNSRTISDAFGPETDDWTGQRITLYEAMVEFQGKSVPAIRVRLARKPVVKATPQRAPARQQPPNTDDDGVPF